MTTQLAQHFHHQRLNRGLSLGQLARLSGYKNITKGMNRISKFEQRGEIDPNLLVKLAVALEVDRATVEMLVERDRRNFFNQWNAWANQPIQPHIVVRLIPAFYVSEPLPEDITSAQRAEEFAAERARHWERRCCLVVTRRYSIWFDEQGDVYERTEAVPGEPNVPYLRLGRRRNSFMFRSVSKEIMFQRAMWPLRPGPSPTTLPRDEIG